MLSRLRRTSAVIWLARARFVCHLATFSSDSSRFLVVPPNFLLRIFSFDLRPDFRLLVPGCNVVILVMRQDLALV